ncbi:MAG: carboxypeptidase regulatory-like domain-containing protein [Desulfobacterales bacterium]|nr:MAG: carboxypeptidase regulatory-like domain-containing protein [Desulfobacterales bacterium]
MNRNSTRLREYVAVYVLLGLVLSFAGHVGADAAQNHWVTFVLQDEKTKASLTGVNFSFSGPGFNKTGVANGSVRLGPLAAGRYMVSFNKWGYFDFNSGLDVSANRSFTITMAKQADVKAVVPPKSLLTIWPLAENGRADLSGANVTVNGPSGQKSITVTKQNFVANFYDLKPGRYSYTVSHSAYQPTSGTVDMDSTSKKTLKVNLSAQAIPVTVRVTLPNGQAAANANVVASGTRQIQAATDTSGVARLNLGPGTWEIQAYRSGLQPAVLRDIKLPGQTSFNLRLTSPTGSLSVRVINSSTNGAVESAIVSISGPNGTFKAWTNMSGVANFKGIPQGDYTCRIDKATYQGSNYRIRLATVDTLHQTFKLTRMSGDLNVKVIDARTRQPVSGAVINAKWNLPGVGFNRGREKSSAAETASNGSALLMLEPASTIQSIVVTADGYKPATLTSAPVPGNLEVALQRAVAVKSGKKGLEVQVLDGRTNQPLPNATVSLPVNGRFQSVKTAANGIAEFRDLPSGRYHFIASKTGYGDFRWWVEIKKDDLVRQTARISAKATTFEVTLVDQKGRPVSGARVNVKWRDSSMRRDKYDTAISGSDGVALLYEVPRAMRVYVSAAKQGFKSAYWSLPLSYRSPPGKLKLTLASAK